MSTGQHNPFTLPNGNSLTATSMFCGVNVDSNGNAVLPTAGGSIVGVMYGISGPGSSLSVRGPGDGKVKVQYGGTVTLPAVLKINASGQFVTASASDIAAGAGIAIALKAGASGEIGEAVLVGGASPTASVVGTDDIALGTTAPSNLTAVTFVQTSGTNTGVLANGVYAGQTKRIVQSVATSTPVGTITGTFKTLAGAAATTLALGTAVATIADFVWDGSAWRASSAITGTGSSLT